MRIPIWFFFGGMVAKSLLIFPWYAERPAWLLNLILDFDPLGVAVAYKALPLFVDTRGIAPAGANDWFVTLLVVGFGLQCFVLGLAVQLWKRKRMPRATPGGRLVN